MVESAHLDSRSPKISQQEAERETPVKDNINYRRHKGACPFYRENWSCDQERDTNGGQLLYQIICLMDTPPVTAEEQHKCLHSPTCCWRLAAEARRNGRNGAHREEESEASEEQYEDATHT